MTENKKRTLTGIDKEREITFPRPSIYYRKSKCNDNDEEIIIEVVGKTINETRKTFREIERYLNNSRK